MFFLSNRHLFSLSAPEIECGCTLGTVVASSQEHSAAFALPENLPFATGSRQLLAFDGRSPEYLQVDLHPNSNAPIQMPARDPVQKLALATEVGQTKVFLVRFQHEHSVRVSSTGWRDSAFPCSTQRPHSASIHIVRPSVYETLWSAQTEACYSSAIACPVLTLRLSCPDGRCCEGPARCIAGLWHIVAWSFGFSVLLSWFRIAGSPRRV